MVALNTMSRAAGGNGNASRQARAAVIAGVRTPLVKAGANFRTMHVTELARVAMQQCLYRSGLSADQLDEVILGNVVMPADAGNPARVAALWAGIPDAVPALTVQRNCASGMEAVADAARRLAGRLGDDAPSVILAGGAESMSTIPLLFPASTLGPMSRLMRARNLWQKLSAAATLRPRHFRPIAGLEVGLTDPTCGMIMGQTAELLASEFGISRREQDEFALASHQSAAAAMKEHRFDSEICPVYVPSNGGFEAVTEDIGPRAGQTVEALAKLKPIFDRRDGTVTVGNSCQVTDGAAVLMLANGDYVEAEGLEPLGYVRAYAYAGLDPSRMGLGPVFAIDRLLKMTGLKLSDIPLLEINEAFAAQVLACVKAMASAEFCRKHLGRDDALGEIDMARLNVNGGGIALGHPVGATGARLVLTLLLEMRRRDVDLGIAALCVGGGQGAAILLERR
jgi:acetyl-CoA C-acetyltransferase/acetyl-CoA acyltransferase